LKIGQPAIRNRR